MTGPDDAAVTAADRLEKVAAAIRRTGVVPNHVDIEPDVVLTLQGQADTDNATALAAYLGLEIVDSYPVVTARHNFVVHHSPLVDGFQVRAYVDAGGSSRRPGEDVAP